MIRLATVFSGIGAIEHALQRMEIDSEIVFACDNGDVELEIAKTENCLIAMENDIKRLRNHMPDILAITPPGSVDYAEQLERMLQGAESSRIDLVKDIESIEWLDDMQLHLCVEEAVEIVKRQIENVSSSKRKKYKEIISFLLELPDNKVEIKYILNRVLKILDDDAFTIDENLFVNLYRFKVVFANHTKKIVEKGMDIKQRVDMLFNKIYYLETTNKLSHMNSYDDKKKYVDQLYAGKDKNNKVKSSYMANYKIDPKDYHWNVAFLDGRQYRGRVDLFVGGSPCQSFSLVGKQRGLEDTRGTLFYEFARLVNEIQPKVFVYENVKALLTNDEGKTWEKVQEVFTSLNYNWFFSTLNAKDYGIPQCRDRVFVVGFRSDISFSGKFVYPPKKKKLRENMKSFLLDNVSRRYYLNQRGIDFVNDPKNAGMVITQINGGTQLCQTKNFQFNWHGNYVYEEANNDRASTIRFLQKYYLSDKVKDYVLKTGTKGFYSAPKTDLDIARPLLTTMHKMHRAGVDNYVTTNGNLRRLTPRECLRLMGFCDSFKIVVSDTAAYQQAGNSIVVDVLISIMDSILKAYPELDSANVEEPICEDKESRGATKVG